MRGGGGGGGGGEEKTPDRILFLQTEYMERMVRHRTKKEKNSQYQPILHTFQPSFVVLMPRRRSKLVTRRLITVYTEQKTQQRRELSAGGVECICQTIL